MCVINDLDKSPTSYPSGRLHAGSSPPGSGVAVVSPWSPCPTDPPPTPRWQHLLAKAPSSVHGEVSALRSSKAQPATAWATVCWAQMCSNRPHLPPAHTRSTAASAARGGARAGTVAMAPGIAAAHRRCSTTRSSGFDTVESGASSRNFGETVILLTLPPPPHVDVY